MGAAGEDEAFTVANTTSRTDHLMSNRATRAGLRRPRSSLRRGRDLNQQLGSHFELLQLELLPPRARAVVTLLEFGRTPRRSPNSCASAAGGCSRIDDVGGKPWRPSSRAACRANTKPGRRSGREGSGGVASRAWATRRQTERSRLHVVACSLDRSRVACCLHGGQARCSAGSCRDHWLSGTDWRNRARQAALDRASMSSGHVADVIFDMFERFEGR